MIIRAENNLQLTSPKTYLSNLEVSGTTIFRLRNSAGFGSAWAIQIGETGDETAEVRLLSGTPSGTVGTVTAASLFEHPADTPVYGIKWNQVVFERATAGTTGTATAMTDGTVTITPDSWDPVTQKSYTIFDDATGSVSYAYRTYLRNSSIPLTSTESDWIVITPNFYELGPLRNRVRESLWNSQFVTDGMIDNWLNEWREEMTNAAVAVNEEYAIGTVQVAFGTAGLGTVTTTDFRQPRRVEVTYNGNDWFLSTKQNLTEFLPNQIFNSTHPYHNWQGDTIFRVLPAETGGTAQFWFYRTGTPMINDTDGLALSLRSYTKSFVDYAIAKAYQKDGKPTEATIKLTEANAQKQIFVSQVAARDKTGPLFPTILASLDGDDNL